MNNQRNNNNRRRGRGNNRGGGGGGNPVNRIDSRARGNAPQMLEKYRKLAHEASLNDDRVQTEYYLQFADHYFRVIADAKAQKDEQQGRQRSERDPAEDGDDYFEDDRFGDRRPQQQRTDRAPQGDEEDGEMQRGTEGEPAEEEANPFLAPRQQRRDRDNRDREGRDREGRDRDNRNRNERRPRREDNRADRDGNRADAGEEAAPTFDPGMLPPSISRSAAEDEPAVPVETAEAAPAPKPRRTRTPRKKSEGDGGGEALEVVG